MICEPFKYDEPFYMGRVPKTPKGYVCASCKRTGLRLFRAVTAVASSVNLACLSCALREGRKPPEVWPLPGGSIDEVNSLVAAVPTEEGNTFWGLASVPVLGVHWFHNLPLLHCSQLK